MGATTSSIFLPAPLILAPVVGGVLGLAPAVGLLKGVFCGGILPPPDGVLGLDVLEGLL